MQTLDLDVIDKYRRLRILYNRMSIFGKPIYYSDWFSYDFPTALGNRKVICTTIYRDTEEQMIDFYYEKDGKTLFIIKVNREKYHFSPREMTEDQAWLAISELEELSYKLLEEHNV